MHDDDAQFDREWQWIQEEEQARRDAILDSQRCIDCVSSRVMHESGASKKAVALGVPFPIGVCLIEDGDAYAIALDDTAYSVGCDCWEARR